MIDPTSALTSAINDSTKVASSPLFMTVIDKLLGFKISEWNAQGEIIKKQIADGYEEAKKRGMGIQYVSAIRQTTNLLNISTKASKYINKEVKEEITIENDVFWGLIEHSKQISNEEMQELIAKILAGEYNKPGMYSMSTLQTIKMLGKHEIELFEKMCSLIINEKQIPRSLFSLPINNKVFLVDLKLDFEKFQSLQNLGLFLPNPMLFQMDNIDNQLIEIKYFNQGLIFAPQNNKLNSIKPPECYILSFIGTQLITHLKPKFNKEYLSWLKVNYKISNYELKSC